jgi:hypothetical protein
VIVAADIVAAVVLAGGDVTPEVCLAFAELPPGHKHRAIEGLTAADCRAAARQLAGDKVLADLLDELDRLLGRFVVFPSECARHAVAVWVVHTWTLMAHESTPRLALLSPEKGSGKTRALEVLEMLCPGALHTVNLSAAALFRKVSQGRCTLLLDEADTYLGLGTAQQHEDLRGLVNAGHRRGAVAYR